MTDALDPYDAVVLVSFGGPERAEDVLPFLRRVTAGRAIPDERLAVVGQHYYTVGGRSPINDENRALVAAIASRLAARRCPRPVVLGNRNWAPELVDALREVHDGGARRVLAVLTSAYPSYSSCRQYRENVADALAVLAAQGRALDVDVVRPTWNGPAFADAVTRQVVAAVEGCPGNGVHLVYVTHSIPLPMADRSGTPAEHGDGGAYVGAHEALAAHVSAQVQARTGRALPGRLVYCSRSGRPSDPWLEPDVNDHLRDLAAAGARAVVVVPLGFLSDHMEVVWDLDHEARATARAVGLDMVRVPTVGTDPGFVEGVVDLLVEQGARARGEQVLACVRTRTARPPQCPAECCPPPARPTSARPSL